MNVMLDLETMGVSTDSAIIAIGAVLFDENEVIDKFYRQVSLQSSVDVGCVIDPSTILWWLQQSDAARLSFLDNGDSANIGSALCDFDTWVRSKSEWGCVKVWGNGVGFDNIILGNAYRKLKLNQPWKFWNDRCYRTVKAMNPDIEMIRLGTHHNALDDAESQAIHLIQINSVSRVKFL